MSSIPQGEIEAVARAMCQFYCRMYGALGVYAVCDSDLAWDAEPIKQGLAQFEARDLANTLNAIAAIAALDKVRRG